MRYLMHSTAVLCLTSDERPILAAVEDRLGGVGALLQCLGDARLSHTDAANFGLVPVQATNEEWNCARGAAPGSSMQDRIALTVAEMRGLTLIVEDAAVVRRSRRGCCRDWAGLVEELHRAGGLGEASSRSGAVVLLKRLRPRTPAREALIALLLAA